MILVVLKTNTGRTQFTKEITDTPMSVIQEAGLDISDAQLNLDGTILTATDLNSSFEALGVVDGKKVNLNCVVKGDGGHK